MDMYRGIKVNAGQDGKPVKMARKTVQVNFKKNLGIYFTYFATCGRA